MISIKKILILFFLGSMMYSCVQLDTDDEINYKDIDGAEKIYGKTGGMLSFDFNITPASGVNSDALVTGFLVNNNGEKIAFPKDWFNINDDDISKRLYFKHVVTNSWYGNEYNYYVPYGSYRYYLFFSNNLSNYIIDGHFNTRYDKMIVKYIYHNVDTTIAISDSDLSITVPQKLTISLPASFNGDFLRCQIQAQSGLPQYYWTNQTNYFTNSNQKIIFELTGTYIGSTDIDFDSTGAGYNDLMITAGIYDVYCVVHNSSNYYTYAQSWNDVYLDGSDKTLSGSFSEDVSSR